MDSTQLRRDTTSLCLLAVAEPENLRESMRHEHALLVLAWTRLELSTDSDLCMLIELDR
jgi:hypothetical protein